MDFLDFFTNYKQDLRLQNVVKFDPLVWPTFEIIIDFSMHNVYWDTLYAKIWSILIRNTEIAANFLKLVNFSKSNQ